MENRFLFDKIVTAVKSRESVSFSIHETKILLKELSNLIINQRSFLDKIREIRLFDNEPIKKQISDLFLDLPDEDDCICVDNCRDCKFFKCKREEDR
jgi:hypothetical protein